MADTVLIVDDTPASRDTIEALLFREGYQLEFAESAWACLEYLEENKPDLILLDVMMPGMDGFELCQKLKIHPEYNFIPIILLTALNKKEDMMKGLEAGADEFVSKPVSGPEIRARVRNLLRLKRLYDQSQETLAFRQKLTRFLVHDMRNPLIAIRLTNQLAQTQAELPEIRESLGRIEKEATILNRFLDEILLASQLESDRWSLRLEPVDLRSLVCYWKENHLGLGSSSVELRVDTEEPIVPGDINLLARLVDNLLSNAQKYGEGQAITVEIQDSEDQLTLRCMDQGVGVKPEFREQIFQAHGIAPLASNSVSQIGLGLHFCKLVAEAHGGSISYKEGKPKGSVFEVSLPKRPPQRESSLDVA